MGELTIRRASEQDAEAMSALRIASITALCALDHDNDVDVIAAWAGNKDAQAFRDMLLTGDRLFLVAELDGRIVGLGGAVGAKITLNYVHPDFRFQGISKAVLGALESAIAAQGFATANLESTATALAFYRASGWIACGGGSKRDGYPMTKHL